MRQTQTSRRPAGLKPALLASAALILPLGLGACGIGESLGFGDRPAPDEFAVVARAPLSMPPDATLRPPRPGAQRPQEDSPTDRARQSVFGIDEDNRPPVAPAGASVGEVAILRRAGAEESNPNIRTVVEQETASILRTEDSLVDRILFWRDDAVEPATIVNPRGEEERIRRNQGVGDAPTEGETPQIDVERERGGLLEGLF